MNEEPPARPTVAGKERSATPQGTDAQAGATGRWQVGLVMISAAVLFLLGFVPMWLKSREYADQRDAIRVEVTTIERDLELARLEILVASAAIEARRGEYEAARQSSSRFFQSLQEAMDRDAESTLSIPQREQLEPLLPMRDDLITLLARSDPASAERLTEIYLTARKAFRSP